MASAASSRGSLSEYSERTARSTDVLFKDPTRITQPPPLNYNLRDRKLAIAICWALILLDSMVLAVVLYYPLVHATNLEQWKGSFQQSSIEGSDLRVPSNDHRYMSRRHDFSCTVLLAYMGSRTERIISKTDRRQPLADGLLPMDLRYRCGLSDYGTGYWHYT